MPGLQGVRVQDLRQGRVRGVPGDWRGAPLYSVTTTDLAELHAALREACGSDSGDGTSSAQEGSADDRTRVLPARAPPNPDVPTAHRPPHQHLPSPVPGRARSWSCQKISIPALEEVVSVITKGRVPHDSLTERAGPTTGHCCHVISQLIPGGWPPRVGRSRERSSGPERGDCGRSPSGLFRSVSRSLPANAARLLGELCCVTYTDISTESWLAIND
jgi:hypothetical protein